MGRQNKYPPEMHERAVRLVFEQLRLNADQYRLLTDHYPFRTLTERRLAHTLVNGDLRIDSIDTLVIDKTGVSRSSGRPQRLEPGERTPWVDISCRDTTHPAHLQLNQINNSQNRRATLFVELASAPDDGAILRTIDYREENSSRLLLNLPPYPARVPQRIETGEETLERIVGALQASPPPVGRLPARTLSRRWCARRPGSPA